MSVLFFLVLLFSCTSSVSSDKDDENALLRMKKQLGDPDFLSSWVKGFQYCPGHYIAPNGGFLHIECMNLTFGRVTTLVFVELNDISAPFPDAICSLTGLYFLQIIFMSKFYGPIPSCVPKLPNLFQLDIRETSLSGALPDFYNHPKLAYINLSQNRFSGTIPSSLFTLPNLLSLDLSSNNLTGNIPSGPYSMTSPFALSLSNNHLTGEIPKCFATVNFTSFDARNNQLSGDASPLFGKQNPVFFLYLSNNEFDFDLSYIQFSDYTISVDLSHNKIYGKVPDSFANAAILYQPNLSFNKLCGELPQGGNMGRFKPQVFANNSCLCGSPLPPCYDSAPAPASPPPSVFSP